MAKEFKWRRGTTAQHTTFIGAEGEVTVDTDKDTLIVHDGLLAGGFELARADFNNVTGPVGIGVSSPSAKLDVNGDFRADNYANRNKLINGGLDIWQRGTSFTPSASTVTYTADRMAVHRGTTDYTVSRQGSVGAYSIRVQRNSGTSTTNNIRLMNFPESVDIIHMAGKEITVSMNLTAGDNFSAASVTVQLKTGEGIDQSASSFVSGTWTNIANAISQAQAITIVKTRYTFTATLGASVTQLGLNIAFTGVGTAGADDWYEMSDVQLEIGGVATEFDDRHIADELDMAQRYYRTYGGENTNELIGMGQGLSSTLARVPLTYEEMRTAPTFSISAAGDWGMMHAAGTIQTITSLGGSIITKRSLQMDIGTSANMVAGNATIMRGINTSARITLDAEF